MDTRAFQKERKRLEAERDGHMRCIAGIDTQLAELEVAERVAARLPDVDDEADPPPMQRVGDVMPPRVRLRIKIGGSGQKQVKDMLLDVLRDAYPDALTASELRERALERYGKGINPNTLTVSLVRYRHDGLVTVANKQWRYVPQPSEQDIFGIDETADDGPESNASAVSDQEPRGEARGGGP